jgi:hypothetical protein
MVDYFQRAIDMFDSLPAHFLRNAGEMEHEEWADQHEQKSFVPAFHPGAQVGYAPSRPEKRTNLFTCIAFEVRRRSRLPSSPEK